MDISGIISAVIIGLVIGALGRLVLPGRQHVGLLWTLVVGIIAALAGTAIAGAADVADTRGIDWIELAIQVGLAAVGVGVLEGAQSRGRAGRPR
ncbi:MULTISPECIES: GlsB/YeaQ/YmgE family stress response membrane protein [unclassified Streptomyces]|uniref:GlsB/YeaQ/YmgE family stress response membrane protein n=1 Tax=unclassified Streptomyces TaxID=2593676 RepID=UPI002DDBEE7C|nr:MULTISPECIES: GlsB/YeaQ/YmgE family stress response membrane protein [unclassified Streptomyces]WSA96472.1 GlsB/YeaQ/YmgE family stress response membrane protein [Streptomyces sp. NBC_01795]WSB80884.1 GlsB/YeaQ/YmgE family stress response membrane protein [Streptomyces sp. NBC_01775]WSS10904.1 GlsB/YeaQ/YmgE family stress response membrane protein [Streptomyces sp. NBC_01186]WSS39601.1 GlsB/YeaQ/YmgE family stress response membrane protein [Streptomyces sp. NBC_01187]